MTISNYDLTQIITLIEKRLGLSATTLTRIGLENILQQVSSGDTDNFLALLLSTDEHHPVWQRLIHALTIGETYFLRDKEHFRILREHILPRLILERRQANDLRLTIWCPGCSTGEEPYSVATVLYENIPNLNEWRINLLATDINQRAIDIAKQGVYREWSFRHTPDAFKQRYFTPVEERWQIALHIRNMVSFMRMNVLTGMPVPKVDIIFARHMLMYFSRENTIKVEKILHNALANGGWLLMGQAEALHTSRDNWLLHLFPGTAIYQKIDPNETLPEAISYPAHPGTDSTTNVLDDSGDYQKAVDALHADHPDEAEQHLSSVLGNQSKHPQAHILLAAIFANRKIYPEALAHIEAALENSGLHANAHYVKALIQLEQGQEDNAIQSFNAAIYCQRKHALAALMLGNIYQSHANTVKASRYWRNALTAVEGQSDTDYVSELSDMTVTRLRGMINKQQSLIQANDLSEE